MFSYILCKILNLGSQADLVAQFCMLSQVFMSLRNGGNTFITLREADKT